MYSTVHLKNRNCQLPSLVEFIVVVVVVVVVDQYFTICEHSFLLAFYSGQIYEYNKFVLSSLASIVSFIHGDLFLLSFRN